MNFLNYDRSRDWPDNQSYFCKCLHCDAQFCGPKRAPYCWPCDQESERRSQERQAAMEAEYGPFIPRSFFGSLTPIQKQAAMAYRGPEQVGAWSRPTTFTVRPHDQR